MTHHKQRAKGRALNSRQLGELLKLCKEVNRVDDSIGQRSDHEGDEDGPTYQVFMSNPDHYSEICDAMMAYHRKGERAWRKLQKLHRQCVLDEVVGAIGIAAPRKERKTR